VIRALEIAHWLIPWSILIIGLNAIVQFVRGHIDEKPFTPQDVRLFNIVCRLLILQGVVGLIVFFWRGLVDHGFPMYLVLHTITMFIAAAIPNLYRNWRPAEDPAIHIHHFYVLLASFLAMLIGISLIPM